MSLLSGTPNLTGSPSLTFDGGTLLRDGRAHRVLSGSMHYFRVHPDQWEDRLRRVAALGLNTVDTYVAWNFHHRRRNAPADFSGWRDLRRFLVTAQRVGLDVIVRPGPYICAEWDNGGLPAWLTAIPGLRPRSRDPRYLDEVGSWFDQLIPMVAALQRANGGPVIAVQVENEYGSYGDDHHYLAWMRDALVTRGVIELLYTADGPTDLMLDGGMLPGTWSAATFGTRAHKAAALLRARRPDEPFMCAEFWNGWFDHWGERHHVRSTASAGQTLQDILDCDGSVSIYMAHGGTNFGLWSGANHDGHRLQPTVTSYDSDAPIAEDGRLTDKFFEIRRRIRRTCDITPPPPPPSPSKLPGRRLDLERGAGLLSALVAAASPVSSPYPLAFEELGQSAGLLLYRARPRLPAGNVTIRLIDVRDRAQVFVDGTLVGVLDDGLTTVTLLGHGERVDLDLLVENQGRINYGPLLGQGKGVLGGVQIDQRFVHNWSMYPLPIDEWDGAYLERISRGLAPPCAAGFATARFTADKPADTFMAFPGSRKGFAWINGFLLGRYWDRGPQSTLYVPGPLVRAGENTITVLETEHIGTHIELRESADLGPEEEYIEFI